MAHSADREDSVEEMCCREAKRPTESGNGDPAFNKAITHLLHSQAALCTWESRCQKGPQMSLPQTSTIHLSGQSTNLGCGALTGLVGQLEERGINDEGSHLKTGVNNNNNDIKAS